MNKKSSNDLRKEPSDSDKHKSGSNKYINSNISRPLIILISHQNSSSRNIVRHLSKEARNIYPSPTADSNYGCFLPKSKSLLQHL